MMNTHSGVTSYPGTFSFHGGNQWCFMVKPQPKVLTLKDSVNVYPALQHSGLGTPLSEIKLSKEKSSTVVQAAWTRRSSGQPPARKNKKSWGQRVDKYMKPFILDINISRKYISAKVMHRVTSKVVSVVSTNSKDLRNSLPSLSDANACRAVGKLLAERAKEADVFAVVYEPRKNEKLEGKLALVLDTILANDIVLI